MTTFYFGKLTPEELDFEYLEVDSLFKYNGNLYWYKAEVNEDLDGFVLYDTCDRHFPVGFEHGRELGTVMFGLNKIGDAVAQRDVIVEKATNEAMVLVEHFMNNP